MNGWRSRNPRYEVEVSTDVLRGKSLSGMWVLRFAMSATIFRSDLSPDRECDEDHTKEGCDREPRPQANTHWQSVPR